VEKHEELRAPEEIVSQGRTAFIAAISSRRADAVAALYAPGARLLAPTAEVIEGRAAIEAYWQIGLESGLQGVDLEPLDVQSRDGALYEIGRYAVRVVPTEGGAVTERGTYLLVHSRQADGAWRCAVATFNPENPGGRSASVAIERRSP
jgi:ketosteroid isomerase-like protein